MFNLKDKRIAVFGLGVSGLSAIRFLHALGAKTIAINSGPVSDWAKSPGALDYLSLSDCFSENDPSISTQLKTCEIVILSPGIPRDHHLLKNLDITIWGELELAYRYLEAQKKLSPIIGITGTNGKTTTTTFLGEMIETDELSVFVGGNIGVPFCDYAFSIFSGAKLVNFILLELSSFQLESIDHFHVNVAIFLNLYQNHGERYATIEDYGLSKFNITNRFSDEDTLIYPEDFPLVANWALKEKGKKYSVDTQNPKSTFDLKNFKLPGIHNRVNLSFILIAAKVLGLRSSSVQKCIDSFQGVHHRIEYVDGVKNLPQFKCYNDAKSTNWDATITAVKAMEDMPGKLFLIIGGKARGHGDSISPYLEFLKSRVHFFYLIGEMGPLIEAEVKGMVDYKLTGTLEDTVADLRSKHGQEIGILLFSPGFPSFDQFKNYAHRGEQFINILTN